MPSGRADEYFACPHCGFDVSVNASFCRECGADDRSGWSDDGQGYDDADDDFDYDDFVRREFPEDAKPQSKNVWLIVLVVVLCLGMLGFFI